MQTNPKLDAFLQTVADAYDAMHHEPHQFTVAQCYASLKLELLAQFELLSTFIDVRFTEDNPYSTSAAMFSSIERDRILHVYTYADIPPSHPFAEYCASHDVTFNSIFRAVHDGFAHYPERNNFAPVGEYRAFRAHARLLSPLATWALATETLGQNAWFNYGPYAHLHASQRPYAPQKAGLLLHSLIDETLRLTV